MRREDKERLGKWRYRRMVEQIAGSKYPRGKHRGDLYVISGIWDRHCPQDHKSAWRTVRAIRRFGSVVRAVRAGYYDRTTGRPS